MDFVNNVAEQNWDARKGTVLARSIIAAGRFLLRQNSLRPVTDLAHVIVRT
jgi:hypothetical protein